jgi:CRISPR system Cascade subunit CasD
MTRCLLMRLEGPLASFGGPRIDGRAQDSSVPTRSMVTGLLANAAGWSRRDRGRLQALQDSLEIAVGIVSSGRSVIDFQTADLSAEDMAGEAWTLLGRPFRREGSRQALGSARCQWKPYLADSDHVVAAWTTGNGFDPDEAFSWLDMPKRPLFLGRSSCIPSRRIAVGVIDEADIEEVLRAAAAPDPVCEIVLPIRLRPEARDLITVHGTRDWLMDRHAGSAAYARIRP